ncbi:Hypothetical predicted protein [Marmota monax]|uniref:Uncharacterized protein n=1 Tax=Marmota monax TaxID=9995 RepID=A0A5E4BGL6_MARMO|nr:hypothetical protein GHT09_001417 [Marmota monax]VTJ68834.1 Hypothetical predicted protein [Marmota monax]
MADTGGSPAGRGTHDPALVTLQYSVQTFMGRRDLKQPPAQRSATLDPNFEAHKGPYGEIEAGGRVRIREPLREEPALTQDLTGVTVCGVSLRSNPASFCQSLGPLSL